MEAESIVAIVLGAVSALTSIITASYVAYTKFSCNEVQQAGITFIKKHNADGTRELTLNIIINDSEHVQSKTIVARGQQPAAQTPATTSGHPTGSQSIELPLVVDGSGAGTSIGVDQVLTRFVAEGRDARSKELAAVEEALATFRAIASEDPFHPPQVHTAGSIIDHH